MMRGMFQNSSYFTQLVVTLAIAFLMNIIFSVFAMILAIPLYHLEGMDFENLLNNLDDPRNIAILKFFQIILSLGGFVFSALLLAYLFSGSSTQHYLRTDRTPGFKYSVLALLVIIVVFPVINLIGALNSEIHFPEFLRGLENYLDNEKNEQLMEKFLGDSDLRGLFVNIVMIGIIPAIGEELFFRGVVQTIFTRMTKNHHYGIWISAGIFSLIHMQFSGFFPRLFLGVLFGYMLVWSRSMWVPILAHFVNNVSAVIMYYFVNTGQLDRQALEYGSTMDLLPLVIISAILTGVLLWYFYRYSRAQSLTNNPPDI